MTSPAIGAGGFTFDLDSVGGRWFWTVQANNIQGSSQLYQVTDIRSPFGRFVDVDLPLPGDVVAAMASTLAQFQLQLAPLISLVSPGTSTFSITVTEGDPNSVVAIVPFQNSGAFGSFLTATATPSVPWLSANPPIIAGLNQNQQGQFTITILPATLLASGSPYTGLVNLQDNRITPTSIPITVNVTVLPRPTIATDVTTVNLSYSISGGPGGAQVCNVSNSGPSGSLLNVTIATVQSKPPWLAFTPTSIGPLASTASAPITFSVVNAGVPLITGTYQVTMIITSPNATDSPVYVLVNLVVSP
jgi:hypothetical protein